MKHGKGLDCFLGASSKSPKSGGAFLGSWKKNVDEQHGKITVWLPVKCMPFSFWAHPMQAVIESQDKLKVVPRMFGCHEATIMKQIRKEQVVNASLQRWRLDNGEAEHKPELCPQCILTDVVARMVDKGELGFTEVVFEWVGTDSTVEIMAGGIAGTFRKKPAKLTRDQQVAMRKAGVREKDAYKHDMKTNMKFFFVIADDGNPDKGLLTTSESEGFGEKVKAAIFAEKLKVAEQNKFTDAKDPRLDASPLREKWDLSLNPYPFVWIYDDTQEVPANKAKVVAMNGTEIPEAIRELIFDTELPDLLAIEPAIEPGNCYELRAELEAHCKVQLPWDEIFGPAKAAGLMHPPGESKEERTPEVTTKAAATTQQSAIPASGAIRIGDDHIVWKNKAFKPGPEFKGREVHLLAPEGATDADVSRAIAAFKTVAKEVAEIVSCEHCGAQMTTFDPSCPKCGAEYSDEGVLTSRPCVKEGCGAQVPLVKPGGWQEGDPITHICPKCATMHILEVNDQSDEWKKYEAPAPVAATSRRRRGGGSGNTIPF